MNHKLTCCFHHFFFYFLALTFLALYIYLQVFPCLYFLIKVLHFFKKVKKYQTQKKNCCQNKVKKNSLFCCQNKRYLKKKKATFNFSARFVIPKKST